MNFLLSVTGLLTKLSLFVSTIIGSVVDIEDSEVPETAAAHCTIHWSILCVIAIYGIFAVFRAAHLKKELWSEDTSTDSEVVTVAKGHGFLHFDSLVGAITLIIICFTKYYWTCSVDYKVAAAGALIVTACTVMLEIQNYKLSHRETC